MSATGEPMRRKPRIMPPIYFFLSIGIMVALDRYAPGLQLIAPPFAQLGWIPLVLGFTVAVTGASQFRRKGTTIKPYADSSALVTSGAFAFSRNPMYSSMMAGLIGVFVLLGSLTPVLVIPVFYWIIRNRFIAVEERMLEENFGDAYRDYKSRVRRWL